MQDLAVERFYLVTVELADGTSTQLKVRGETPAEAFKEVRARADVRRVGKVTEIGEGNFSSNRAEPARSAAGNDNDRRHSPRVQPGGRNGEQHKRGESSGEARPAPQAPAPGVREALIGFSISGPRVARPVRRIGGEQPFKNLKAPPGSVNRGPHVEPTAPAKPAFSPFGPANRPLANDPSKPSVFAQPVAKVEPTPAVQPAPAADEAAEDGTTSAIEYRIVKSRRQTGLPYLLQRGTWSQQKGKRVFASDWEKDFDSREKAEKHQSWLEQMAIDAAELSDEE